MKASMKALFLVFVLGLGILLGGCSAGTDDAKAVLDQYLAALQKGGYSDAYELLSAFDKANISSELFEDWRKTVEQLARVKEYSINSKVDRFKNFQYLGTTYKKAFGLEVTTKQEELVAGAKLEGYDRPTYKIMVVQEGEGYKVALLLTKLDETVSRYKSMVEQK